MNSGQSLSTCPSSLDSSSEPFKVLGLVNESRFAIYKVLDTKTQQICALKLFAYKSNKINKYYKNEARFTTMKHQNVIRYFSKVAEDVAAIDAKFQNVSFVTMEWAPYGDMTYVLSNTSFCDNVMLARTYFHQLIEGINYLHSSGIFHLDLKLDNLLIADKYALKIADFDMSFKEGDNYCLGNGTSNYRAPELKEKNFKHPGPCDIYSAGIILFMLVVGHFPYSEKSHSSQQNLWNLMLTDDEKFWSFHMKEAKNPLFITRSFKALFKAMTRKDPKERISIKEIKNSEWYQGPVYLKHELEIVMKRLLPAPL